MKACILLTLTSPMEISRFNLIVTPPLTRSLPFPIKRQEMREATESSDSRDRLLPNRIVLPSRSSAIFSPDKEIGKFSACLARAKASRHVTPFCSCNLVEEVVNDHERGRKFGNAGSAYFATQLALWRNAPCKANKIASRCFDRLDSWWETAFHHQDQSTSVRLAA